MIDGGSTMSIDDSLSQVPLGIAIAKIMDTRTRTDDAAGDLLAQLVAEAGHHVVRRERLPGELEAVVERLQNWIADLQVDCVIALGGTGLSARDVTPQAFSRVWDVEVPGFGEIFRQVSFRSVGSSALASRACAGLANGTAMFAVPSSPGAVRDAWDALIRDQIDSRHKPCNLVEHLSKLPARSSTPTYAQNEPASISPRA